MRRRLPLLLSLALASWRLRATRQALLVQRRFVAVKQRELAEARAGVESFKRQLEQQEAACRALRCELRFPKPGAVARTA